GHRLASTDCATLCQDRSRYRPRRDRTGHHQPFLGQRTGCGSDSPRVDQFTREFWSPRLAT
ncbi:MAG: hypothetical protein DMG94_07955, partial [Acidobacteria bacterium]